MSSLKKCLFNTYSYSFPNRGEEKMVKQWTRRVQCLKKCYDFSLKGKGKYFSEKKAWQGSLPVALQYTNDKSSGRRKIVWAKRKGTHLKRINEGKLFYFPIFIHLEYNTLFKVIMLIIYWCWQRMDKWKQCHKGLEGGIGNALLYSTSTTHKAV